MSFLTWTTLIVCGCCFIYYLINKNQKSQQEDKISFPPDMLTFLDKPITVASVPPKVQELIKRLAENYKFTELYPWLKDDKKDCTIKVCSDGRIYKNKTQILQWDRWHQLNMEGGLQYAFTCNGEVVLHITFEHNTIEGIVTTMDSTLYIPETSSIYQNLYCDIFAKCHKETKVTKSKYNKLIKSAASPEEKKELQNKCEHELELLEIQALKKVEQRNKETE